MRRIQTLEFKVSVLIVIIISFIVPANVTQNGIFIEYKFGFPCRYWSIYQNNKGSLQLLTNLFDGNIGMGINLLYFFGNILIIYAVLILIKKIYIKINNK
ncbi:hypothetical protein [Clostridium sp. Marseille-Q2269]|uniref:hypothetical protein n=1 Tax=Clostridium sp. Marseille-Q2269 TaxID=2942205 RepID=UPI002073CAF1|nr:hypothetical protein [Clostridium sp. Marseille-Q2269]